MRKRSAGDGRQDGTNTQIVSPVPGTLPHLIEKIAESDSRIVAEKGNVFCTFPFFVTNTCATDLTVPGDETHPDTLLLVYSSKLLP